MLPQSPSNNLNFTASEGSVVVGRDVHGNVIINNYAYARPVPVKTEKRAAAHRLLARLPLGSPPDPGSLPPGSYLPFTANPLFTGRTRALLTLARAFTNGLSPVASTPPSLAISGLGGLGKTQLAIEFAHRYGRYFAGGVFWINCTSPADMPSQVALCGGVAGMQLWEDYSALKLDEQVALVLSEWQNQLPRLLIFDNCESAELLQQWRPPSGGSRILLTTRNPEWDLTLGVQNLSLDVLQREASIALLLKFRPDLATEPVNQSEEVKPAAIGDLTAPAHHLLSAIAEELGDLPLALHLVGHHLYHYRHEVTPATLLAELRQLSLLTHPALTGHAAQVSPTRHDNHLARTFAISTGRLNLDDTADALALRVLAHTACFAPGLAIPRDLLRKTLLVEGEASTTNDASTPPPITLNLHLPDALIRLTELGLLTANPTNGALMLHRLLAQFVQPSQAIPAGLDGVLAVANAEAHRINEFGLPAPLRPWVGHLRHLAKQAAAHQQPTASLLLNALGHHLQMEADHAGARAAFEQALAIDEAAFGPNHPNVARDANGLGGVLHDLGDHAGARAAFERALAIDEAVFGPNHPNVARDVNGLGGVLHGLGDHAGARAAFERALAIDEAAFGPNHPNVARDVNNLGGVLQARGEYAGAQVAYTRALAIDEAAFGPNHPNVATLVNNLGSVLHALGDYAGARVAYARALAILKRTLDSNHPSVGICLKNLSNVLQALGNHAEAQKAFAQAQAIAAETSDPEQPKKTVRFNRLASVLYDMGDYIEGQSADARARAIDKGAFGPDHDELMEDIDNLCRTLQGLSPVEATQRVVVDTINNLSHPVLQGARAQVVIEAFVSEDAEGAVEVSNLGVVLQALSNYAGAQATYGQGLVMAAAAFCVDYPKIAVRVNNLGAVLQALGNHAAARAAFARILGNNLGAVLHDVCDRAKARVVYAWSLANGQVTFGLGASTVAEMGALGLAFGPKDPQRAAWINNLGGVLQALGEPALAQAAYTEALAICENSLGPDHPNTHAVRLNLVTLRPPSL